VSKSSFQTEKQKTKEDSMTKTKQYLARGCMLVLLAATATGCSNLNQQQERALSGGAIGAGAGAVVGALTGSWLWGALIGGAGGAAIGAFTSPSQVHVGN
jgi:osmotically inducible lipoprotein OsmB